MGGKVLKTLASLVFSQAGCGESVSAPPGFSPGETDSGEEDLGLPDCFEGIPDREMGLKINEVSPGKWIEIFNKHSGITLLDRYRLTNRHGNILTALPSVKLGPCDYYVADAEPGKLDPQEDAVAIFRGDSAPDRMVDFMAYSGAGVYPEGRVAQMALDAGHWKEGDVVNLQGESDDPTWIEVPLLEGESLGRDVFATDSHTSADWSPHGGAYALEPSPGALNFTPRPVEPALLGDIPVQPKKKWAFLVYMAADNNLDPIGFIDLNKLEETAGLEHVHIGVFADFAITDLDRRTRQRETAAYLHIRKDRQASWLKSDIQIISEPNTGDPETLKSFLKWAKKTLPADNYYLVIWGHGNGWKGTAVDYFDRLSFGAANDRLSMSELGEGLAAGPPLEILAFYSCLMGGIEVAAQVRPWAKYLVASQEVMQFSGTMSWPWPLVLQKMEQEAPLITPAELAVWSAGAVNRHTARFAKRTVSAVKLEGEDFLNLIESVSLLARDLKRGMEDFGMGMTLHDKPEDNLQRRIRNFLEGSPTVESFTMDPAGPWEFRPDYRDLYDLARMIREDGGIAGAWKGKIPAVMDGIENAVVVNHHGSAHPRAKGLSVYFPKAHTKREKGGLISPDLVPFDFPLSESHVQRELYAADDDPTAPKDHPLPPAGLEFTARTLWDEFLNRYYNPVADASCRVHAFDEDALPSQSSCETTVGSKVKLKAAGSSDADGKIERYCWDLKTTVNEDALDADKDNADEADDDCRVEGRETEFICPSPAATHRLRLMVWDDHHKFHTGHYQTDDAEVTVRCIEPQ